MAKNSKENVEIFTNIQKWAKIGQDEGIIMQKKQKPGSKDVNVTKYIWY